MKHQSYIDHEEMYTQYTDQPASCPNNQLISP